MLYITIESLSNVYSYVCTYIATYIILLATHNYKYNVHT